MKKFLVVLLIIPLFANSAQNFNTAKTKLIQLYKSNPAQTEFYCGCDISWTGKKGVVDFQTRKFQPREEVRGVIARTYFYMRDKYNINLSDSENKLMIAWNEMYPPKQWECDRNRQIERIQGNDNKFITEKCTN